jgi:periplasmic divalent cation tolerance protein
MVDACVIQCAAASETEAEALAAHLLAARLAACVQLTPIRSRYVWKGETERADEVLLSIKTRLALFDRVREAICELHSYKTPEILALPVIAGDADYLAWIADSTS